MRSLLATMATAPLLIMLQTGHAAAQNYPWCAEYALQGSSNCGFATPQQCFAALSGNGGYCILNPMYRPEIAPPPLSRNLRH